MVTLIWIAAALLSVAVALFLMIFYISYNVLPRYRKKPPKYWDDEFQ